MKTYRVWFCFNTHTWIEHTVYDYTNVAAEMWQKQMDKWDLQETGAGDLWVAVELEM